jgi:MFS family permease
MNNINNDKGKLWSKDYVLLMISNFFLFFGDILLLPVLPVYVKQNGVSDIQVGIVIAIFFATSLLMRMFTSRASARFGKRTVLLLSVSCFALSMLGYYLFASLIAIIVIRMVQGLSFGASSTLYSAVTANIIPNERMGEGFGYFGLLMTIATALGPLLGAAAVSLPDYNWVFLVALLLGMTGLLSTCFITVDNRQTPIKKFRTKDFLSDMIEPKVFYEAVFLLLVGLAMGGYNTYVILFAREISVTNIAVYFLATALAELIVRTFSGKLYDRKGMNIVVIPGAMAGIISCVVMANATNLAMISMSGFLFGTAIGMIFPVMEASAMKKVDSERRIAASATLLNLLDIGSVLGPLLFGVMIQLSGYPDTFLLSSLIFMAMAIIPFVVNIIKRKSKNNQINT